MPLMLPNVLAIGKAPVDGVNEKQRVTITGTPTGGSFTLAFTMPAGNTQTTAAIAYNATAAAVQAALEALSNIGAGQVSCSGGPLPGTAVDVTFIDTLGGKDMTVMTTVDSLTGGTLPASAVTTPTAGVRGSARGAKVNQVLWDYINGDLYVNIGAKYTPVWDWYADID